MQAVFSKEHGGIVLNQVGPQSLPWWSGIGSQSSTSMEHFGHLKSAYMEHIATANQISDSKRSALAMERGLEKDNTTQFAIFSDDCKIPTKWDKTQVETANPIGTCMDYRGHFELGCDQPVVSANYVYEKQYYGVLSIYGPQVAGRIMLPLKLTGDEGPIFVNAKQYHGIIRRRQSRAKAELENKVSRRHKPYLHHSRHLHALRRPRGCGGRFLNTKILNGSKDTTDKKNTNGGQIRQPAGSQVSEVVQSNGGNMNSPKEINSSRSTNSGTPEVTTVFFSGDFNSFPVNHHWSSPQPLPNMMNDKHGVDVPSNWAAAADSCCNLEI